MPLNKYATYLKKELLIFSVFVIIVDRDNGIIFKLTLHSLQDYVKAFSVTTQTEIMYLVFIYAQLLANTVGDEVTVQETQ